MRENLSRLVAALFLVCSWPAIANAQAGEREIALTFGPAYSATPNFAADSRGFGGLAGAYYGFTDLLSLGLTTQYAHHFPRGTGDGAVDAANIFSVQVGPALALDIIEVVPFISLAAAAHIDGGALRDDGQNAHFGLRAAFGIDWRFHREWSVGAEVHWHGVFPEFLDYPGWSVFAIRVSRIWETDAL